LICDRLADCTDNETQAECRVADMNGPELRLRFSADNVLYYVYVVIVVANEALKSII